jgi:hypothetical protein
MAELVNFRSGESGRLSAISKDAEKLGSLVSKITGAKYEMVEARPNSPFNSTGWYLLIEDEIPKIAHTRKVWFDNEKNIRIESMYLGNTTEWIEQKYGEEGVMVATKLYYPDLQSTQKMLSERFPLAGELLEACRRIIDEISSKYGIHLEIRSTGGKIVTTFFMGATINVKGLNEEQKVERIKRNLAGLKEAWDRIGDYEAEWQKRQR